MVCTITGAIGGTIAYFFGGWDQALVTLIIFMAIDYISGLIVAGVFHNSKKTESGTLESRTGWKGLCRKCMTLLFVLVAYRLDLAIGVDYIRECGDHRIYGERADQHRRECRTDGHTAAGSDRQCDRHTDTESREKRDA